MTPETARQLTRSQLAKIWRDKVAGRPLVGEAAAIAKVMEEHLDQSLRYTPRRESLMAPIGPLDVAIAKPLRRPYFEGRITP